MCYRIVIIAIYHDKNIFLSKHFSLIYVYEICEETSNSFWFLTYISTTEKTVME